MDTIKNKLASNEPTQPLVPRIAQPVVQTTNAKPPDMAQAGPAPAPPRRELEKSGNIWARIKRVKNIEIYGAVLVILVMVAIYATNFIGGPGNSRPDDDNGAQANAAFAREMESRLVHTLSQVRGAGEVRAMVSVVGSSRLEIAYNVEERTVTQGGVTTTTVIRTPIMVNGPGGPRPVVIHETKPEIKGVVIVATGAGDISVRLLLQRAVQTLISDPGVAIEILAGR